MCVSMLHVSSATNSSMLGCCLDSEHTKLSVCAIMWELLICTTNQQRGEKMHEALGGVEAKKIDVSYG